MNKELIEKLKKDLPVLAEKYRLGFVVLFGSQAKGTAHSKSDVDLAFYENLRMSPMEIAKMQFYFSETLRIKDIELTSIKDAPPLLLRQIAQHAIVLYEKEEFAFANFKIYAYKRHMEAKPLLKLRQTQLNNFLQTHVG